MKKLRENKAITLIALVITIIVLLILAGITIAQLSGHNLFENAKLAKEKYKDEQENEDRKLSEYANEITTVTSAREKLTQEEYDQLKAELLEPENITISDVATGWNIQNNSFKIGKVVYIDINFKKTSSWTVGWNQNVCKISKKPQNALIVNTTNMAYGYSTGEINLGTDGAIAVYETKNWTNNHGGLRVVSYYITNE